jgi:hypothetical protein
MKLLEKIVQKLIINNTLTDKLGLFYVKIGITVFSFHYVQHADIKAILIFRLYGNEHKNSKLHEVLLHWEECANKYLKKYFLEVFCINTYTSTYNAKQNSAALELS